MNWKIRIQNPQFWWTLAIGALLLMLGQMGYALADVTSWQMLGALVLSVLANPFYCLQLLAYILAAVFDFTTPGFNDSVTTLDKSNINQTATDVINTATETQKNVTTPTELAVETEQISNPKEGE